MNKTMSSFLGFLGGWMVTPALFLMGVAAIASPIVIHLLNKRKFKRVEWAAMDFLLEADKKNRRRVRLENLLLLLLRCLACILIGLLLARPFKSLGKAMGFLESKGFERIVVLDDSLSMAVKSDSNTSMDNAKKALVRFVTDLAGNNTQDDFTLYRTSDPKHPMFNAERITEQSAGGMIADIEETVQISDKSADLAGTLREIEKSLKGRSGPNLNYVVYVISDMRALDWPHEEAAVSETGIVTTLKQIADHDRAAGCYLVDVGRQDDAGNVYVERIRSKEKALVADVRSEFEITVRNTGKADVNDAQVRFDTQFKEGSDQAAPLKIDLPKIPAGGSVTESFNYTFVRDALNAADDEAQSVRIEAKVEAPQKAGVDELAEDNTRFFAAHVVPGVKTLIVDGDRTGDREQWESFYLTQGLSPPGKTSSGVDVDVVGESQFETLRLDDYQVIYLCNLYRIPDAGQPMLDSEASEEAAGSEEMLDSANHGSRLEALKKWVSQGGGLVLVLGDQTDVDVYNRDLYDNGKGLLPFKLEDERGDLDQESWCNFNVKTKHPVMSLFEGQNSPFVEYVKIFRWWHSIISDEALEKGQVNVIARFTNVDVSPAVVEKQYGDGRVLAFAMPLTVDWSDWPQDHSFVPTILELNKYMARKTADQANVQVGDDLHSPLDLTRYELMASVKRPDGETGEPEVSPDDSNSSDQVLYKVKYDDVDQQGFYDIQFTRSESAGNKNVLFAANIDTREGDLARANTDDFVRKLGDSRVQLVNSQALTELGVNEGKREHWRIVLLLLVGVLCTEQVLGWLFGRKR